VSIRGKVGVVQWKDRDAACKGFLGRANAQDPGKDNRFKVVKVTLPFL